MKKYFLAGALSFAVLAFPIQSVFAQAVTETLPAVTTEAPTSITATGATFNGTLTDLGGAPSVSVGVDLGLTAGTYTFSESILAADGPTTTGSFVAFTVANGLPCGTTIHFRVNASNDAGTTNGDDMSFDTLPCSTTPAAITTLPVDPTTITDTTVTLPASVTSLGELSTATATFGLGTTSGSYTLPASSTSVVAPGSFSLAFNGLTCNTQYFYQAQMTGSTTTLVQKTITASGTEQTFTTAPCVIPVTPVLSVNTLSPDTVTSTSANLNGVVPSLGTLTSAVTGFQYGLTTSYGSVTPTAPTTTGGDFSEPITGLSCETTYHYRAFVTDPSDTDPFPNSSTLFGSDVSLTAHTCSNVSSSNQPWLDETAAPSTHWSSIASSADGMKLAAVVGGGGDIYTSTDSGITWNDQTTAGSRFWQSVTSSSDGTKLAAVVNGGDIYTSTDSGATWTDQFSAHARNWEKIVSSSDGTKLAAVTSFAVYTSTDSGVTWVQSVIDAPSHNWADITSSSDGTKLAVIDSNNGYVYTSTDSGATWIPQTLSGTRIWTSIASSADGTKLVGTVNFGDIFISNDSGATWTDVSVSGPQAWQAVTMSSDGTKLAAVVNNGLIYLSSDSGATWTSQSVPGTKNWFAVSASGDGMKFFAAENGGDIWTTPIVPIIETLPATSIVSNEAMLSGHVASMGGETSLPVGFQYNTTGVYAPATTGFFSVTTVFDFGMPTDTLICNTQYHFRAFAIGQAGPVYGDDQTFTTSPCVQAVTVTPSGFAWIDQIGSGIHRWLAMASSADGTKLAAIGDNASFGSYDGYIYMSNDSGVTWIQNTAAGDHLWTSIASSADCTHIIASESETLGQPGYLYVSNDSGATWTKEVSAGLEGWGSVASSADGMKLAASHGGAEVATSTDGGTTWTEQAGSTGHLSEFIASSADGKVLVTGSGSEVPDNLYISTDSGVTWTKETGSDTSAGWTSAALSADGTKMVAVQNDGYIYTSTDTGVTWTKDTAAGQRNWTSVTSSSDGMKLAASDAGFYGDAGGYLYLSTDGGTTWIPQTSPSLHKWGAITSSSDGTKVAAGDSLGDIWTLVNPPTVTTNPVTLDPSGFPTTFNGTITALGGENATERGFELVPGPGESFPTMTLPQTGSFGTGDFTLDVSGGDVVGFSCGTGTTYYYDAYAKNDSGTSRGAVLSFVMPSCGGTTGEVAAGGSGGSGDGTTEGTTGDGTTSGGTTGGTIGDGTTTGDTGTTDSTDGTDGGHGHPGTTVGGGTSGTTGGSSTGIGGGTTGGVGIVGGGGTGFIAAIAPGTTGGAGSTGSVKGASTSNIAPNPNPTTTNALAANASGAGIFGHISTWLWLLLILILIIIGYYTNKYYQNKNGQNNDTK